MLNKTGQTGNDVQWQKAVPPVKPVAPVASAVPVSRQPSASDTTRFIQSADVAEGLLYTEALRQSKEDRAPELVAPAQQDLQQPRSLADLPYLVKPEYAAYRKHEDLSNPKSPMKMVASSKGKTDAKRSMPLDSTGVWVAAIVVAVAVVVVKWLF